jgi:hypothetical protein
VDYLHPDDRTAYDELPEQILIYRGCSRSRVKGASWTTDINVAKAFAEGHRGIAVPDPVIASLRVPKSSIIGYYTARKESEVVISPWECQSHPLVVRAFTA